MTSTSERSRVGSDSSWQRKNRTNKRIKARLYQGWHRLASVGIRPHRTAPHRRSVSATTTMRAESHNTGGTRNTKKSMAVTDSHKKGCLGCFIVDTRRALAWAPQSTPLPRMDLRPGAGPPRAKHQWANPLLPSAIPPLSFPLRFCGPFPALRVLISRPQPTWSPRGRVGLSSRVLVFTGSVSSESIWMPGK